MVILATRMIILTTRMIILMLWYRPGYVAESCYVAALGPLGPLGPLLGGVTRLGQDKTRPSRVIP